MLTSPGWQPGEHCGIRCCRRILHAARPFILMHPVMDPATVLHKTPCKVWVVCCKTPDHLACLLTTPAVLLLSAAPSCHGLC
jgi:hypothetical protein